MVKKCIGIGRTQRQRPTSRGTEEVWQTNIWNKIWWNSSRTGPKARNYEIIIWRTCRRAPSIWTKLPTIQNQWLTKGNQSMERPWSSSPEILWAKMCQMTSICRRSTREPEGVAWKYRRRCLRNTICIVNRRMSWFWLRHSKTRQPTWCCALLRASEGRNSTTTSITIWGPSCPRRAEIAV